MILEAPFIIIIKSNSGRKQTQANILRKWRGQKREQIDGARGEGGREGRGRKRGRNGRQRERNFPNVWEPDKSRAHKIFR